MFKKIMLALALLVSLTACGSNNSAPVSLNGSWSTEASPDFTMTAVVSDTGIEVTWKAPDTTALYWVGTLPTSPDLTNDTVITSQGDTEAMAMSLLASQSETKDFTYKNDKLAFDFTIMGVTKTLYLEKV